MHYSPGRLTPRLWGGTPALSGRHHATAVPPVQKIPGRGPTRLGGPRLRSSLATPVPVKRPARRVRSSARWPSGPRPPGAGLPAWRRGPCVPPPVLLPGGTHNRVRLGRRPHRALRGQACAVGPLPSTRAHGSLAGPACHPRDSPAPAASRRRWSQLSSIACKRCYSATHNLTRVASKRVRANSELPVQNRSRCNHRCSVSARASNRDAPHCHSQRFSRVARKSRQ